MGFGLLFFGYLITYLLSINHYAAFLRLVGYAVMFAALGKLRRHNRWFAYAHITAIPLLGLALGDSVIELITLLMKESAPAVLETLTGPVETAMTLFVLFFHVCLLLATYTIAADTDLPKLARQSRWNLVLMVAYAILHGVWSLPVDLGDSYTHTLSMMIFLLQLIWTFCNLFLIWRCYMWICLEGDEEMGQKPSRFAFINQMREKQAAREQKAADEAAAYAKEKREKQRAKLGPAATKPKYHKKKKKK